MSELTPEQKKEVRASIKKKYIYALHAGRRNSFVLGAFIAVNSAAALTQGMVVVAALFGAVSFLTIKDAVALHEMYNSALATTETKDEESEEKDV